MDELPATRCTWGVRSTQTGVTVIFDVPEGIARSEADRLDAEAATPQTDIPSPLTGEPVPTAAEGLEVTTYETYEYAVLDEREQAKTIDRDIEEWRAGEFDDKDEAVQSLIAQRDVALLAAQTRLELEHA